MIIVDIRMKLNLIVLILYFRYHDNTSIVISIIFPPYNYITIFFLDKQILLSMTDYCINNVLCVHEYQSENCMINSIQCTHMKQHDLTVHLGEFYINQ
jgi:hypothetical protein